jgi:hypothetical protein
MFPRTLRATNVMTGLDKKSLTEQDLRTTAEHLLDATLHQILIA